LAGTVKAPYAVWRLFGQVLVPVGIEFFFFTPTFLFLSK
jgi:hypothetical protein